MSSQDFSHQLRIASPCNMDWDSMIGNDRVRFCDHCQLSVHNVDLASRKQIRRLVARSKGRLCVTYRQTPARVAPPLVLHKISRCTSVIAASAFSATLSISTAVGANPSVKQAGFSNESVSIACLLDQSCGAGGAALRGVIFDPNGAVIPGATVTLTNPETNDVLHSTSNGDGEYRFEGLKPANYTLRINFPGFQTLEVVNITLGADDNQRLDQTLRVAETSVLMGAVAVVTPSDPLVKAAMEDDLEALRTALLNRSDPNVRDKETDSTALEHAFGNGNREMVQVLLWAKVDVNTRDGAGQSVLMNITEQVTSEMVWDLINAGAKVNLRDSDGDSPLIGAAEINNVEALKALLDAGAKVNDKNNEGQTALMIAAKAGLVNNVRTLIMAGADVNARDKNGKTALMYATEDSQAAVVRLLKSHGAIEFEAPEKQ